MQINDQAISKLKPAVVAVPIEFCHITVLTDMLLLIYPLSTYFYFGSTSARVSY